MSTTTMTPNKHQSAIVQWVRTGRGHGAVSAVAGSGKTTTLVKLVAPELVGDACFVAFNRSIATELGEKLRGTGVASSTIHSAGYGAVRRVLSVGSPDGNKGRTLARELVDDVVYGRADVRADTRAALHPDKQTDLRALPGKLARLWDLVRNTGKRAQGDAALLSARYDVDVDLPEAALDDLMQELAHRSMWCVENRRWIDYTDMLYLVWCYDDVRAALRRYDWLLVDEAQDLNWLQREVCKRMLRDGGRMLLVGDPRQAIYGFTGADPDSFDQLVKTMDAKVMPLSVCYRCPTKHIELAKQDVPHIEAAPGAIAGELHEADEDDLLSRVGEGDLVLCRTTAPLVQHAMACIRSGIAACVRGRDIGEGLKRLVREGQKRSRSTDLGDVLVEVVKHAAKQVETLSKQQGTEMQQQSMQDRVETIQAIAESCQTPAELLDAIDKLFDDRRASVVFSTIHRAKGLEADTVHLVRPDLLPHPMARGWQVEQETHLRYVAHTRAKRSLTIYSR